MEKTPAPKSITLRQFQARFPTEDACLEHLKMVRYGAKHTCAKCDREARYYRVKARRSYECEHCGYQVYPTAGTPFEKTRTPLRDWFYVMFLFTTTRNGVAAKRVQREIGVTYKTAWRMCHLIRHYMGYVDGDDKLGENSKTVEVDKTFVGGHDKVGEGDKFVVLGMVETGGNVVAKTITSRKGVDVIPAIQRNVKSGAHIVSDKAYAFQGLSASGFQHTMLNHTAGERSSGSLNTNTMEGFWNLVKRGINGTYISVSQSHLQSYLNEFEFRFNLRKQPHLMLPLLLQSFARGGSQR